MSLTGDQPMYEDQGKACAAHSDVKVHSAATEVLQRHEKLFEELAVLNKIAEEKLTPYSRPMLESSEEDKRDPEVPISVAIPPYFDALTCILIRAEMLINRLKDRLKLVESV